MQGIFNSVRAFACACLIFSCLTALSEHANAQAPHIIRLVRADSTVKDSVIWKDAPTLGGHLSTSDGKPIEGARIYFDNTFMGETDANGNFQFVQSFEGYPFMHNLVALKEGFRNAVRSYHPSVHGANFEITMEPGTGNCCRTPGFALIALDFEKKEITLDDTHKLRLDSLGEMLRNNPSRKIRVMAYTTKGMTATMAKYRQENVRNYLSDIGGISGERILLTTEPVDASKRDRIEIGPAK